MANGAVDTLSRFFLRRYSSGLLEPSTGYPLLIDFASLPDLSCSGISSTSETSLAPLHQVLIRGANIATLYCAPRQAESGLILPAHRSCHYDPGNVIPYLPLQLAEEFG